MSNSNMVTVYGAKQKESAKQHLVVGEAYEVSEEMAKVLIENGQASEKVSAPAKKAKGE